MQASSVFDLSQTKKAGVVNIVACCVFFAVIVAFFCCLKTGDFKNGILDSIDTNKNVGIALLGIVLIFFSMLGVACLTFSAVYKIIFGIVLLRSYANSKGGQLKGIDGRLFMASAIVRIATICICAVMASLVSAVIALICSLQWAIIFGLILAGLTIFEVIGVFVEKKAKQEQIAAKQYESAEEFFN